MASQGVPLGRGYGPRGAGSKFKLGRSCMAVCKRLHSVLRDSNSALPVGEFKACIRGAGNFRAGGGYYHIINLVGPPISPLVWQAPHHD